MDRLTDIEMERQIDEQMDRLIDIHMERQID